MVNFIYHTQLVCSEVSLSTLGPTVVLAWTRIWITRPKRSFRLFKGTVVVKRFVTPRDHTLRLLIKNYSIWWDRDHKFSLSEMHVFPLLSQLIEVFFRSASNIHTFTCFLGDLHACLPIWFFGFWILQLWLMGVLRVNLTLSDMMNAEVKYKFLLRKFHILSRTFYTFSLIIQKLVIIPK